uniref:BTB domain-containing protein n=1 Tax=Panagrellus redivivus TaxID=6233 RepID=A0A7E4WAV7_PANRE
MQHIRSTNATSKDAKSAKYHLRLRFHAKRLMDTTCPSFKTMFECSHKEGMPALKESCHLVTSHDDATWHWFYDCVLCTRNDQWLHGINEAVVSG